MAIAMEYTISYNRTKKGAELMAKKRTNEVERGISITRPVHLGFRPTASGSENLISAIFGRNFDFPGILTNSNPAGSLPVGC